MPSANQHTDPSRIIFYDEDTMLPGGVLRRLDFAQCRAELWFPVAVEDGRAIVAAVRPEDPAVARAAAERLGVAEARAVACPEEDVIRLIENNYDINPNFPPSAGRTPLAKARTFLAGHRSFLSGFRTTLARGRTGLSMFRTGLAFLTIFSLLMRLFGLGWLAPVDAVLLFLSLYLIVDGLVWYLPVRRHSKGRLHPICPTKGAGLSVIEVLDPGGRPRFVRSPDVPGAAELFSHWDDLTGVERRRVLALERTEYAAERTRRAILRTTMARSRTGMALGRTGISLAGLGFGLVRRAPSGPWQIASYLILAVGLLMIFEGLRWYLPGREAGRQSLRTPPPTHMEWLWSLILPPALDGGWGSPRNPACAGPGLGLTPGIFGTTGLALERTLLAERRNLMAGLRTNLARSRTGLAYIRTGMNFTAVGAGLLIGLGYRHPAFTILEIGVIVLGVLLVLDGCYWHIPARRAAAMLPYCHTDLEIPYPDYGEPAEEWSRLTVELEEGGYV
ncbi:General secretory system II protein E domain protein [Desulfovibrio sp. X2]|uniref:GspE/PulE/PilB domain-containing protein n=1 Tax=Desulfovibrio sp. X2 TaxID=941449 RepID=UPI000358A06F|nr:General secretory system II protein E domain protein [Desulfovibrio sp. X2]EPR41759.1 General secretory system II protein E domain protein [Desulfovibrio sp. X2]